MLKAKLIQKPNNKKVLLTPSKMIMWGFNLIVSYTFLIGLGKVFTNTGNYLPIILIIGSVISLGAGLAFGKMSKIFSNNGGALLYTREVFGKKTGGIFGFFQMMQLPFVASTAAIAFVWAFQNIKVGNKDLSDQWYIYLFAICLYSICSIIPRYGFSTNRVSLLILWTLKWLIIVASIVFAFWQIMQFPKNIGNGYKPSSLTYLKFVIAIMTFFFAFGGFEALASMSDDLEKPKRNMIRVLIIMICMIFIFYIFYYFIILGSVGIKGSDNPAGIPVKVKNSEYNPINSIFAKTFFGNNTSKLAFGAGIAGTIISLILVVTQISNKSASKLQSAWANTRVISAYASCGFLPKSFIHKNKYGQFRKAFWLDFCISFSLAVLFLILNIPTLKINYAFSGALSIVSYLSFLQYLGTTCATLWLAYKKPKILKLAFWEIAYFIFVVVGILILLVSYVISGFISFIDYVKGTVEIDITIVLSTLLIILLLFGSITLLWVGKIFGWDKNSNSKSDEDILKEVDDVIGHGHGEIDSK